jgi:hypothetical protein
VRVTIAASGSAKPIEVAKALGVYGPDDPRATHAMIARLGLVFSPSATSPAAVATTAATPAAPAAVR